MRSFPLEEAGDHEQRGADGGGRREPQKHAAAVGIVASDDGGEDEMKEPDEEVGDAEQHGVVSEGARHRQADAEHRPHRGEHRQPDAALVDVQCARQPRVQGPCPPERREDEHPAEHSTPGRVVREQARDLGDREHEDQIEEQFERGDLVLVAVLEHTRGVGHTTSLAQCRQRGSGFVRHVRGLRLLERRRPASEQVQRLLGLRTGLSGIRVHRQTWVG